MGPTAPHRDERRAHPRHPVVMPATMGTDDAEAVGCTCVDLSLGGARIEAPVALDGERVVMALALDEDRVVPVVGRLVDQAVDTRAGVVIARVAFEAMSTAGRAHLAASLADVSPR